MNFLTFKWIQFIRVVSCGGGCNCYFQLNIYKILLKYSVWEENLDVEVDKWTTFYNKVPVDSRPQDVCTALAACDQNYVPAINWILFFVLSQLVVLRVKDPFLYLAAWASMSEDPLGGLAIIQVHRHTELIQKPKLINSRKSNKSYLLTK